MKEYKQILKLAEFHGWTQLENTNQTTEEGLWMGYAPDRNQVGKKNTYHDTHKI